jgi:hypothetical protein
VFADIVKVVGRGCVEIVGGRVPGCVRGLELVRMIYRTYLNPK